MVASAAGARIDDAARCGVLRALSLVLAGPTRRVCRRRTGMGRRRQMDLAGVQWPLGSCWFPPPSGCLLLRTGRRAGLGLDHAWGGGRHGAWLLASLAFKLYVAKFTDYNASYGTVGGVIVMMLWFYISGIALILGAETNATIEYASPHGKAPGQKGPSGKRLIGARAARAFSGPIAA